MGLDQREALRFIGTRLKATHVADNSGFNDDHIMPFQGTIDWRKILPVLHEIEYSGDLTYEIHCSTSRLPDNLLDETASLAEKVGRYLLLCAKGEIDRTL
jgi:sugar phosphate isomerase/epimerase